MPDQLDRKEGVGGVCDNNNNHGKTIFPQTPEFCPFSVEIEPSSSLNLEHLRLSTVNKSWSLAMKTTIPKSHSTISHESEQTAHEEEFPLNEMDAELGMTIQRALSNHEKAPRGVPVSSDSESSSQNESADMEDSDDENDDSKALVIVPPSTPGARIAYMKDEHVCVLSPRMSKTPTRHAPQQAQYEDTPGALLNPLQPLKVLNPGIPQDHGSHLHGQMKRAQQCTPQRSLIVAGDHNQQASNNNNTALATANTATAATSTTNCLYECFAIEDFTQFFCPATPKSTTIDTTTSTGIECFPAYAVGNAQKPFGTIQNFWASNPPLPRSRGENLFDANLPRNRPHGMRRKHVRNLLDVWHGSGNRDAATTPKSVDDASFENKQTRRRKRGYIAQLQHQKNCYDSDPEQEVLGRRQRRAALLSGSNRLSTRSGYASQQSEHSKQETSFRKFRPSPFTHLDTDEESVSESEAEDSSYETAQCRPPSPPAAPRNSNPKISFDFGKALETIDRMEEDDSENDADIDMSMNTGVVSSKPDEDIVAFEFGKGSHHKQNTGTGHRRNVSATSLSTTGHSRFHTLKPSGVHEESSSESSTTSSISGTSSAKEGQQQPEQQHLFPSYFKSHPTHWTEFQLLFSHNVDEEAVKTHVHELSNIRFPLVWHPPAASSIMKTLKAKTNDKASSSIECPTAKKIASLSNNGPESTAEDTTKSSINSTSFPIAVNGVFEVGAHLEHLVVQPKFLWTPLTQPNLEDDNNLHNRSNNKNSRELFLSKSAPPQVELLSIIRVNKAGPYHQLDRNQYPYARLDRTCVITTNEANHPTIVLEARSTQERDWLVFSLKLIVARLASIIITRDEYMLHEFFSPYSALMQLEEEDELDVDEEQQIDQVRDNESLPPCSSESQPTTPNSTISPIDCDASPFVGLSSPEVGLMVTGEPEDYANEVSDSDSVILDGDEMITLDGEEDDDDDDQDSLFQDRDDRDQEDSIRARNSGAYAILRRSLTATGRLVDHDMHYIQYEEEMVRTLSY